MAVYLIIDVCVCLGGGESAGLTNSPAVSKVQVVLYSRGGLQCRPLAARGYISHCAALLTGI